MVSDRKIETLKEALEKKRGDLEQEVSLLFLKDFRFFFFLSKLGTKEDQSNPGGEGTAHWITAGSSVLPRDVVFAQTFDSESTCFSVAMWSCSCLKPMQIYPVSAAICNLLLTQVILSYSPQIESQA